MEKKCERDVKSGKRRKKIRSGGVNSSTFAVRSFKKRPEFLVEKGKYFFAGMIKGCTFAIRLKKAAVLRMITG